MLFAKYLLLTHSGREEKSLLNSSFCSVNGSTCTKVLIWRCYFVLKGKEKNSFFNKT